MAAHHAPGREAPPARHTSIVPGLPPFNEARGEAAALQLRPPFSFKGVTMALFPLLASRQRLRAFCDAQLNLAPHLVRFEPAMPLVFLMLLDYGRMATEVANLGWVSQTEVAFGVPLRWSFIDDGRVRFHDWAVTCPFIFVDNELSMATGREVYGWPKTLAHLDPSIGEWIADPHGTREVLRVSSRVYARTYRGEQASDRPVLSVHHRPLPRLADFPTDLGNLLDPLRDLPRTAARMASLGMELTRGMGAIALEGISGSTRFPDLGNPATYRAAISDAALARVADPAAWRPGFEDLIWAALPRMTGNTINLKQFRDAASADDTCYQAITSATLQAQSILRCAVLGQQNLALGQLDGGYRIDIHAYGSQPIVETLGIEGQTTRTEEGLAVVSVRPRMPLWLQMDMGYGKGAVVAWRSRATPWALGMATGSGQETDAGAAAQPPHGAARAAAGAEPATAADPAADAEPAAPSDAPPASPRYVTARGPAMQAIQGPFVLPDTTVRVLPLLASEQRLAGFLGDYLDAQGHLRFAPWGRHVYLVVYNYARKSSVVNDVGLLSSREAAFMVPARCYAWYEEGTYDLNNAEGRERRDREKLLGVGLVRAFSYVDDATVAITSNEVVGVPTLHAQLLSPPHTWMDEGGPGDDGRGIDLLTISALVLPAVNVDAGGADERLLQVRNVTPLPDEDPGWRHIAHRWGPELASDIEEKYRQRGRRREQHAEHDAFRRVRALALELMTGALPVNSFSLKQFRDSWLTDRACYQGIVLGTTRVDRLHELHEIEQSLHVSITRFPTQPVADTLGLVPKHEDLTPGGIVQTFEAIRPFWLRADLTEQRGRTLFERVGGTPWRAVDPPAPALASAGAVQPAVANWRDLPRPIMAGSRALNRVDRCHVADLGAYLQAMLADPHGDADAHSRIEQRVQVTTHAQLSADLGAVSPATVADSILSRQWARPTQSRQACHKADYCIPADTFGNLIGGELFPSALRQGRCWPPSGDFAQELERQRRGLAWQLWSDVRRILDEASHAEHAQLADSLLPACFKAPRERIQPGAWTAQDWAQIASGLQALADRSHYRVEWSTVIRPLTQWAAEARQLARTLDELERGPLDADADPDSVGIELRRRLVTLAQQA